jgi:hypothetical protein
MIIRKGTFTCYYQDTDTQETFSSLEEAIMIRERMLIMNLVRSRKLMENNKGIEDFKVVCDQYQGENSIYTPPPPNLYLDTIFKIRKVPRTVRWWYRQFKLQPKECITY